MESSRSNRIFGLDLFRSIAVIFSGIIHSGYLLADHFPDFPYIPLINGSELFFVLSGFMIGGIIIKEVEKDKKFDFSNLLNFLQRRWFRTIPNYLLFLIVNIVLIYFGLIKGGLNKYLITYFVFFQNFYKPFDFLFWESWSLSVQEWFYLFFPFLIFLFLLLRPAKIKWVFLTTIIVFLTLPLLYRITYSWPDLSSQQTDLFIRKLVLTRLDSIGFGLLGAYIIKYHENIWQKLKNISFASGLILLFLLTTYNRYNVLFSQTFYFSLLSFSIFLLLPKFESFKNENIPLKPFRFISKISYSIYLCHIPISQLIFNHYSVDNGTESIIRYLAYWIVVLIVSKITFEYFERPMMNFREGFTARLRNKK